MRNPEFHALTARLLAEGYELQSMEVEPSRLSAAADGRRNFGVIIRFASPQGSSVGYFQRVDVTGKFPFVVTPLQKSYHRS